MDTMRMVDDVVSRLIQTFERQIEVAFRAGRIDWKEQARLQCYVLQMKQNIYELLMKLS